MGLEVLKGSQKTIGTKQTLKAVSKDLVDKVFIAQDADRRIVMPLMELCQQKNIAIEDVETMSQLGKACGVDVATASAAILK